MSDPTPAPPAAPDPAPATPPAADPATITMTQAEADALRRQAREGREATKRAEDAAKAADEARAKEQGQFQELAATRERERDEARNEAARVRVDAEATRLAVLGNFHDPRDAVARLTEAERADPDGLDQAVQRIARESPHLVKQTTDAPPELGQVLTAATGPPGAAQAATPKLTREDVQKMTAQELAALSPEKWQEAQDAVKGDPQPT